jgi:hypothetical protein
MADGGFVVGRDGACLSSRRGGERRGGSPAAQWVPPRGQRGYARLRLVRGHCEWALHSSVPGPARPVWKNYWWPEKEIQQEASQSSVLICINKVQ